jgi:hypothetical protein
MQLLIIQFTIKIFHISFMQVPQNLCVNATRRTHADVGNLLHLAQEPKETGNNLNSSVRETRAQTVQTLHTVLLARLQI